MRSTLAICALMTACAGESDRRPAEEPEAPSEHEPSDGFDSKQQEELSELLGVDVRSEPVKEDPASATPAASSSAGRSAP